MAIRHRSGMLTSALVHYDRVLACGIAHEKRLLQSAYVTPAEQICA
jgi:hypothetical protein